MPSSSSSSHHRGLPLGRIYDPRRAAKQSTKRWMLLRHDAAVRSPLLAARGQLRWRLCDVLEYRCFRDGDHAQPFSRRSRRGERRKEPTGKPQFIIREICQRIFAPRRGPAVGSVARARVSLMVPDYTSIAAAILLGIAGQIAPKSAANGSATVIAQFLNPLTIIGLAILSSRPSKRFQPQSPFPRGCAVLAYPLERAPRLAADGWHCDDRRRRSAGSPALRKPA
jgi:hypothetical protein